MLSRSMVPAVASCTLSWYVSLVLRDHNILLLLFKWICLIAASISHAHSRAFPSVLTWDSDQGWATLPQVSFVWASAEWSFKVKKTIKNKRTKWCEVTSFQHSHLMKASEGVNVDCYISFHFSPLCLVFKNMYLLFKTFMPMHNYHLIAKPVL